MRRRSAFRIGLLIAAVILTVVGSVALRRWLRSAAAPPRNILLITLDTFRTDRLGCYGSKKGLTPRLDALAAEGTRFANAYTPVPLTAPSHAAMLTGRYPISHGLRNNGSEVLSKDETLLSEILHERGFQTAAIISALVLSSEFGINQGFDLYYEKDIKGSELGHGLWYDQRRGDLTVDRALTWLKAEGDRPFFLWVHLFDAHEPYDPPEPYKQRFAKTPYDGEVAFVDAQVGRLLDAVREQKLYDDVLVIVAGDHGEGLGDNGEAFHGLFLYNSTMHVPLIVRAPGGHRGVVTDLASTMDITPTVLDALRIPAPQGMQGVSLLPAALDGARVPARSLFLETVYPEASYGWSAARALLDVPWKLVDLPKPELYEVARDPAEKSNLYGAQPAKVAELRSELAALEAELKSGARETEIAPTDDETLDRLLSLGYVGGQQSKTRVGAGRDPKDVASIIMPLNIATGMMKRKEYADAEEVFRKALELDPDNKIALMKAAQALAAQGKVDAAIPYFEHAVATYPDIEEFYRTYGWAMMRARRLDKAEAVFNRALQSLPKSANMHFLLGYVRFLRQEWRGAVPELDLAIRLNPRRGKPYYLMAICQLESGDKSSALRSLEEYLKRDADIESLFNDPYLEKLRRLPEFQELVKPHL